MEALRFARWAWRNERAQSEAAAKAAAACAALFALIILAIEVFA